MVDKSEKFITLVRLGYAARGVVYVLLGLIALGTVGGRGDTPEAGATSAFEWLQDMPLGGALLYVVALGLLAYGLFKFLSALTDVQHRGNEPMGIAKRVGDFASGVAHTFLAWGAYQFGTGARQVAAGGQSQEMAGSLLTWEVGAIVLGLVGLGFFAGAVMQGKQAVTGDFMKHISSRAPTAIEAIGRAGSAARAVVFALIGWSLVKSAWFSSAQDVKGLGEAIVALRQNTTLYTLIAAGLLLFGVFSLVMARYRIIPDFQRGDLKPKF